MGRARSPLPVKLFVGFIYKETEILEAVSRILIRRFGRIDFTSPAIPFTYTDYYIREMGGPLNRTFASFACLIKPEDISRIKTLTNKIEEKFSSRSARRINIDPGYLDSAKVVLATTKDYVHRAYLKDGIFAEITLHFQNRTFNPWPWTYPDYRTPEYIESFNSMRAIYSGQIKKR
jgi:hypothetical protein